MCIRDREFEGDFRLSFHVGAWPFATTDPQTGKIKKASIGPWAMTAFRWMARLRFLRGSWLDPFRDNEERRLEKRLREEFEADMATILDKLDAATHPNAIRLAALAQSIRGYGHVKAAAAAEAAKTRARLLKALAPTPAVTERAA